MKKQIIEIISNSEKRPLRKREISRILRINEKEYRKFRNELKKLIDEGIISKTRKGGYFLISSKEKKIGDLSLTIHGYGFVSFENSSEDIYINKKNLLGALDGDKVEILILPSNKRHKSQGIVKTIIKRKTNEFIAQVVSIHKNIILNIDPITPLRGVELNKNIKNSFNIGDVIKVKVKDWGSDNFPIIVSFIEKIGSILNANNDIDIICYKYDFKENFNNNVIQNALKWSQDDIIKESKKRKNLTNLNVLTIDPSDARDIDDGISISTNEKKNKVIGVHIADVSFFVEEGLPIDLEAQKRCNSVYFIEGVVRMIPDNLSSNICSLLPNIERLAMSLLIEIDENINIINVKLEKSVIKSKKQFTYSDVQKILDEKDGEFFHDLNILNKIALKLREQRENNGSLDFDIPEPHIELDNKGIPLNINQKKRYNSHKLVEELMLLANRLVAQLAIDKRKKNDGFIFRIHPNPNLQDMENLFKTLIRLDLIKKIPSKISPISINKILLNVKDSKYKNLIEKLVLRGMSKAVYSTENKGHFGLAFENYAHFTSPIRRYADLIIHRYLKNHFLSENTKLLSLKRATELSLQITKSEIKSLEAEREYLRLKQLRWLSLRIGKKFNAIISGVIASGFFAEINESLVEGFIPIDKLDDDNYFFDEIQTSIIGKKTLNKFYLSKEIQIEVKDINFKNKRSEFKLVE